MSNKSLNERAFELVTSWAADRADKLRVAANKADMAYTKGPMAAACREYAKRLREAARLLYEPISPEQALNAARTESDDG